MGEIFVVLPMYRPSRPERILHDLLTKARKPERVRVGVLEHKLPESATAVERYYHEFPGAPLQAIRYLTAPLDTAMGAGVARQEIVGRLYHNEEFVLFLHEHTRLFGGWDEVLLESLSKTHRLGGHVVSQFPLEIAATSEILQDAAPTTFPVFYSFGKAVKGIPVFKSRCVVPAETVPFRVGMASFRCLFGTAEVLLRRLQVHSPALPLVRGPESDFVLSVELFTRGFHVYVPKSSVCVHHSVDPREHFSSARDVQNRALRKFTSHVLREILAPPLPPSSQKKEEEKKRKGEEREERERPQASLLLKLRENARVPGFSEFLGLDLRARHYSGRARLGVTEACPLDEVEIKYGSLHRFEALKASVST